MITREPGTFSAFAAARRSAHVPVITFPGDPATPDAVSVNNVFATVSGRLVVGQSISPGSRVLAN